MPLTSITSCYKTLPSYFADKVTQHVKKRNDNVTRYSDLPGADNELTQNYATLPRGDASYIRLTKRSCTPLATVSDNESEEGSGPRPKTADAPSRRAKRQSPSPRPQSSETTPRGSKRQSPSPRPHTGGCFSSNWSVLHPRRTQTSPRTAISLDNVDFWEEDLSDNEDFDQINGFSINPRMTIDLSELRRSRSPVATKRNKLESQTDEPRSDVKETAPMMKNHHMKSSSPRRAGSRIPKWINNQHSNNTKASSGIIRPRIQKPEITSVPKSAPLDTRERKIVAEDDHKSTGQIKASSEQVKLPNSINGSSTNTSSNKIAKALELRRTNTKLMAIHTGNHAEKISKPLDDSTKTLKSVPENLRNSYLRRAQRIQDPAVNNSDYPLVQSAEKKVKVKFNNYVQVNDGGVNTVSELRESNNSAQLIKQRYLGINAFKKSTKTPA